MKGSPSHAAGARSTIVAGDGGMVLDEAPGARPRVDLKRRLDMPKIKIQLPVAISITK